MSTTETQQSALPRPVDLDAAFDRCGSGQDALRECVLACRRSARRAVDAELFRRLSARGQDARELCARELCARLVDMSVGELLQTVAMGRKDVLIEVTHGALVSRIWCAAGEIVDAVSGRLRGEAAAYRILALDAGELVADFRLVQRPRAIATSTQEVMLEAVRRKDECAVLQRRLGGPQRVYSSVASAVPAGGVSDLESAALRACTPGASIDSVLASSTRADLETLQALSALVARGWLVANDGVAARSAPDTALPEVAQRCSSLTSGGWTRPPLWVLCATTAALGLAAVIAWPLCLAPPPRLAEQSTGRLSAAPAPSGASASAKPRPNAAANDTSPRGAYSVEIAVEPAQATFWLDGALTAAGDLAILLARDGRLHELRIAAPGHVPQTLVFRDVSPPRAIVLERAPAP